MSADVPAAPPGDGSWSSRSPCRGRPRAPTRAAVDPAGPRAEVLDFIRRTVAETAVPPTLRGIARELGYRSQAGVHQLIGKLIKDGHLRPVESFESLHSRTWLPVDTELVVRRADDGTVRVGVTGPVTFTRDQWQDWLKGQLAALA